MNSIPNLPEDIWYKILSEISLSTVVYRGGEEYTQISIVNSMFHNIYKEVLSIQISKSILDDIFNKAWRVCGPWVWSHDLHTTGASTGASPPMLDISSSTHSTILQPMS